MEKWNKSTENADIKVFWQTSEMAIYTSAPLNRFFLFSPIFSWPFISYVLMHWWTALSCTAHLWFPTICGGWEYLPSMFSDTGLPDGHNLVKCAEEFVPLLHKGMMLYPPGPFFSCACSGRSDWPLQQYKNAYVSILF